MHISEEVFGKTDDQQTVNIYTLENDHGLSIKITNFGGIITEILAPDEGGFIENICLGFNTFEEYFSPAYKEAMPYFGAIIGRFSNRIAKGRFEIDGKVYQFPQNNFENTLHGGLEGFDKKIWTPAISKAKQSVKLTLTYLSPDGEEGFPGNLDVKVVYELNNKNELKISYKATTDKKTHLNFTNHTYFNLNACKNDIQQHIIRIDADHYSEVDKKSIPTGKSIPLEGTCMDFKQPQLIWKQIDEVQGNGYDHNYELNKYNGKLRLVAEAFDKASGRKLEVLTTEPGIQFYTANYLDGSLKSDDKIYSSRMGFCFETQHYPDSPNRPEFPSTLLNPGEKFESTTVYKFSVVE